MQKILWKGTFLRCQQHIRQYHSEQLKILFFGTNLFSLHTLKALEAERRRNGSCIKRLESCNIANKNTKSIVSEHCHKHKINLHTWPPDLKLCQEFDLGIVSSFGRMIPARIINAFPR